LRVVYTALFVIFLCVCIATGSEENNECVGTSSESSDSVHCNPGKDPTATTRTRRSNMGGSLDSLIEAVQNDGLKFIFVGGKGGVGKTTTSSAIASLLASVCNKRVLLVSTDPAHSLGDAWRTSFSNVPTSPVFNLDVMEVDPKETMDKELSTWVQYAKEFEGGSGDGTDGDSAIMKQVSGFQEWLSGVPGIDEATALSSAIAYIDSGKYDLIVFDTAPTGHTLKLLALPDILEKGIEKLQSWQTTLWSYWDVFKGLSAGQTDSATKKISIKDEVSQKLIDYKQNIQKVATMLQDQARTRFVVVCIAEFLSVSETQRLLQELENNKVKASHIVVNQLVVNDALSADELTQLEQMAEVGDIQMDQTLLKKTVHACRLTTARKAIQQKYLKVLKGYDEAKGLLDGICEVPLLAEEVTGIDAIVRFSHLLLTDRASNAIAIDGEDKPMMETKESKQDVLAVGDVVRVMGLEKSDYLNGLEGNIITKLNTKTGRYGVSIMYQGETKKIALHPKNISIVRSSDNDLSSAEPSKKHQRVHENQETADQNPPAVSQNTISKAMRVLEDPEIKEMIAKNPRLKDAVEDVLKNPANVMKYFADPELSPFIMKAMGKLNL